MFSNPRFALAFKIIFSILFCVGFFYAGAVILFIFAMSSLPDIYLLVAFLLYLGLFCFFLLLLWNRPLLKKARYVFLAFFLTTAIIGVAAHTYQAHEESIAVMPDKGIEHQLYEPFKAGSQLARLDKPASLKISSQLPRMDSATSFYPIAAAFIEAVYPEGNYSYGTQGILTQTTTRQAFNRLADGQVDIILALEPSPEQIGYAKEKGISFKLMPIGKEAFVFFVNAKNPVNMLSIEQIQDIYSGKITNWKEVGGNDEKIQAFQREKNSGSQTHLEKLMQGKTIMPAPMSERAGGMGRIIDRTADYKNYKNAIGFSFRYYATEMVKNKEIKLLRINDIPATKETVRAGEYPLTTEFYAITAASENPHLQNFLAWMVSPEGQELIENSGYVKIK